MNCLVRGAIEKELQQTSNQFIFQQEYTYRDGIIPFLQLSRVDLHGKGKIENYSLYPGIELSFIYLFAEQLSFKQSFREKVLKLYYCRQGSMKIVTWDQEDFNIGPEDCFIHSTISNGSQFTAFLSSGYYEGLMVQIEVTKLMNPVSEVLAEIPVTGEDLYKKFCQKILSPIFFGDKKKCEEFYSGLDLPENIRGPYFKLKIQELFLYLYRTDFLSREKQSECQEDQVHLVRQIHNELLDHLDQRITIEKLSKKYLINPTTLKAVFKAVYGTSIAAHIKEHRMEKAAIMLRETDQSMAQIAKSVGYESQSKFTSAFKEFFGVLPTEYRKKMQ